MSGGAWGYKSDQLKQQGEQLKLIMETVGETEHIIDWAVSGDSSKEIAEAKVFRLWENLFEKMYGI